MKKLLLVLLLSFSFTQAFTQCYQTTYGQCSRSRWGYYQPELGRMDSFMMHGGLPIQGNFTFDTVIGSFTANDTGTHIRIDSTNLLLTSNNALLTGLNFYYTTLLQPDIDTIKNYTYNTWQQCANINNGVYNLFAPIQSIDSNVQSINYNTLVNTAILKTIRDTVNSMYKIQNVVLSVVKLSRTNTYTITANQIIIGGFNPSVPSKIIPTTDITGTSPQDNMYLLGLVPPGVPVQSFKPLCSSHVITAVNSIDIYIATFN